MDSYGKTRLIVLLALMVGLVACSSAPPATDAGGPALPRFFDPAKDPYWLDPRWGNALLDSVQSVVHDPVDAVDMRTVGPHVTVKFTIANSAIQDPGIIAGTGDPKLDDLLLKQIVTAQVPKPTGLHADEPHGFLLDLDMLTPYESFQDSMYAAINRTRVYPKSALLSGATGSTTVDFNYLDGNATSMTIIKSSKDRGLDKASLDAVTRAVMPPVPPAYAGKALHMEVIVCYCLNSLKSCPNARNVIPVEGTRVVRVTTEVYRPH